MTESNGNRKKKYENVIVAEYVPQNKNKKKLKRKIILLKKCGMAVIFD